MPDFSAIKKQLENEPGVSGVRENVPLAGLTTFKIGGPADLFYEARSADDLTASVQAARRLGIPFFLLGVGANILIGDLGIRGLVIQNKAANWKLNQAHGRLYCETGVIVWPDLINNLVNAGMSGMEHFAGIPTTVGGALWQNLHFLSPAPARERTIFLDEIFHSAEILTPSNERKTVDGDYFEFGYDTSILHHSGDIALSATFQLSDADPERMQSIIDENLDWRALRHPPLSTEPSAGSIFKKIEGIGAGRLIDECGLKGARIGGIEITHRHANIMINRGGGTAHDVCLMIERVKETVQKETGYKLEVEISFVGDFE